MASEAVDMKQLDIIHGGFKYGTEHTSWNLKIILKDFIFLHDTPARYGDFVSLQEICFSMVSVQPDG